MSRSDFDYTMMATFMTCRRKYYYRIQRGIIGKVPQTAPDFGKGIHKALDSWYLDRDVNKAIDVFKTSYKEQPTVDDKRTHKMGEWILKNYAEKYRDQPFEVVETEREFCLPLPNGNNLIGRIDKIIKWDNVYWVMDHKTTSQLGPGFFKMHTPNLQFSGYTWAARQLGYPECQGVLVDAILVAKGLLPGPGKSQTLTPLARDFAYRTDEDIEEYLGHVENIQHDIKICEEMDVWTPNFDACTYYGECPYRRVCKEPLALRERVIGMDYVEDRWDPREEKGSD